MRILRQGKELEGCQNISWSHCRAACTNNLHAENVTLWALNGGVRFCTVDQFIWQHHGQNSFFFPLRHSHESQSEKIKFKNSNKREIWPLKVFRNSISSYPSCNPHRINKA